MSLGCHEMAGSKQTTPIVFSASPSSFSTSVIAPASRPKRIFSDMDEIISPLRVASRWVMRYGVNSTRQMDLPPRGKTMTDPARSFVNQVSNVNVAGLESQLSDWLVLSATHSGELVHQRILLLNNLQLCESGIRRCSDPILLG